MKKEELTYSGYKIHPAANIVPMAIAVEQEALQASINAGGQCDPILLFRGRIVDGRCRAKACEALGVAVLTEDLPYHTSHEDLEKLSMKKSTRRNLTATQRSIAAAKEATTSSLKHMEISAKWGITKVVYTAGKYVLKQNPAIAEVLCEGGAVNISLDPNFPKYTKAVQAVARHIKKTIEDMQVKASSVPAEELWDVDSSLKLEAEKAWFSGALKVLKVDPETGTATVPVIDFLLVTAPNMVEPVMSKDVAVDKLKAATEEKEAMALEIRDLKLKIGTLNGILGNEQI